MNQIQQILDKETYKTIGVGHIEAWLTEVIPHEIHIKVGGYYCQEISEICSQAERLEKDLKKVLEIAARIEK